MLQTTRTHQGPVGPVTLRETAFTELAIAVCIMKKSAHQVAVIVRVKVGGAVGMVCAEALGRAVGSAPIDDDELRTMRPQAPSG